jgi:hypothetical protein
LSSRFDEIRRSPYTVNGSTENFLVNSFFFVGTVIDDLIRPPDKLP